MEVNVVKIAPRVSRSRRFLRLGDSVYVSRSRRLVPLGDSFYVSRSTSLESRNVRYDRIKPKRRKVVFINLRTLRGKAIPECATPFMAHYVYG